MAYKHKICLVIRNASKSYQCCKYGDRRHKQHFYQSQNMKPVSYRMIDINNEIILPQREEA